MGNFMTTSSAIEELSISKNSLKDKSLIFKMSLAGRTSMAVRRLTTSAIRQDLGHVPPPGHTVPFQISNRYKLTLSFVLFFGSGLSTPFIALRHQLLKK